MTAYFFLWTLFMVVRVIKSFIQQFYRSKITCRLYFKRKSKLGQHRWWQYGPSWRSYTRKSWLRQSHWWKHGNYIILYCFFTYCSNNMIQISWYILIFYYFGPIFWLHSFFYLVSKCVYFLHTLIILCKDSSKMSFT